MHSSTEGIKVYSDTLLLGVTPIDSVQMQEGTHVIAFIHPEARNWQYSSMVETLVVHPAEHLARTVNFPFVYHITSTPYGAAVQYGDSVIGQTPLLLTAISVGRLLSISKEGYESVTIPLSTSYPEVHVDLHPLRGALTPGGSIYLADAQSKSSLPIYLTTGTSVLTGVVAAYCKIKADSYYKDYQQTGNPSKLSQVRTLDTVSGISLAASEISLLMLSYFLLSR